MNSKRQQHDPRSSQRNKSGWPRYSHQWMDAFNLAMTQAIAQKLLRNPRLMRRVHATMARWKRTRRPSPLALREWESILKRHPTEEVLALLTQDNETGQRLRQSDPFTNILSNQERLRILERYEKV